MAKPTKKHWSDYLWIVSATYFTLGFFNIVFAWLGVICFLIPLLMAIFGGGKGYCNNYCRPWSTLPPDWQHPEVVAQESGSTMAFVEVVPKRISRVLHVLFHSNDYPHRECGKRRELAARNHTPALDFRCAMALGLPHSSGALGGTIRFRSLRHHAHLAYRGRYPHGGLPSSHMVRVLPNGQYDSNNLQT